MELLQELAHNWRELNNYEGRAGFLIFVQVTPVEWLQELPDPLKYGDRNCFAVSEDGDCWTPVARFNSGVTGETEDLRWTGWILKWMLVKDALLLVD